jgi:hypothetical protein
MLTLVLDASSQPRGFLFVAILIIVVGVATFFGAIFDPRSYFTNIYEAGRRINSHLGFLAVSRSARQFRIWCAVTGAGGIAIGVAGVVVSA